jgi:hypothetical protein
LAGGPGLAVGLVAALEAAEVDTDLLVLTAETELAALDLRADAIAAHAAPVAEAERVAVLVLAALDALVAGVVAAQGAARILTPHAAAGAAGLDPVAELVVVTVNVEETGAAAAGGIAAEFTHRWGAALAEAADAGLVAIAAIVVAAVAVDLALPTAHAR